MKDQIRYFTSDTTSSNTGKFSGCCKRIEEYIGHPVLWFGCRHHVPELMAKDVWYTLFDEELTPQKKFFDTVKSSWANLDLIKPDRIFPVNPSTRMKL